MPADKGARKTALCWHGFPGISVQEKPGFLSLLQVDLESLVRLGWWLAESYFPGFHIVLLSPSACPNAMRRTAIVLKRPGEQQCSSCFTLGVSLVVVRQKRRTEQRPSMGAVGHSNNLVQAAFAHVLGTSGVCARSLWHSGGLTDSDIAPGLPKKRFRRRLPPTQSLQGWLSRLLL